MFPALFLNAQNINRPVPNGFPSFEFHQYNSTYPDMYYLYAPFYSGLAPGVIESIQILDKYGYIAWAAADSNKILNFKYHPEVDLYSFSKRSSGFVRNFELDNGFNIMDTIKTINDIKSDIHEYIILPNGNRCLLGHKTYVRDLSTYTFNGVRGSKTTKIKGAVIQEFDRFKKIVFQWESIDHLDPALFIDTLYNYNADNFDYVHANSIYLDYDDNLLVSFRGGNLVCKIDHQTGNVIWKLGGKFSDFKFVNDHGFIGQHDACRLPNGNISIFDNQYMFPNARGIEYHLDTINMTATLVSETKYSLPFSSNALGSFRVLDNGYKIAGWGNTRLPSPTASLYNPYGYVAADIFLQDTFVSYRVYHQELPNFPDRPKIECQTNGKSITLTAEKGFNNYVWSTNESGTSITITQPGSYQYWVEYGIGLLGSEPVIINDIDYCTPVNDGLIDYPKPE